VNGLAQAAVPAAPGPALDNKRVAAGLIDLLVLFGVGFLLGVLAGSYTPASEALIVAWVLYYYFALESLTGQTVGKKAMGLRVAQVDGSPPEMRQIAIRSVLRLIDGWGLYLVGLITMLATGERRQRLGDLAAKTIVTTADEQPAAPAAFESSVVPLHQPEPEPEPEPEPVAAPVAGESASPSAEPAATEEPLPFEPYRAPAPAEEPHIELVPDPPAAAHPPEASEKPRIEIVSPIDLVMGNDQPKPDDELPPPPQSA
jgi:uncharacterized RDD family membrane protein YckC